MLNIKRVALIAIHREIREIDFNEATNWVAHAVRSESRERVFDSPAIRERHSERLIDCAIRSLLIFENGQSH